MTCISICKTKYKPFVRSMRRTNLVGTSSVVEGSELRLQLCSMKQKPMKALWTLVGVLCSRC